VGRMPWHEASSFLSRGSGTLPARAPQKSILGGKDMTMQQPGEMLLTGQVDGRAMGQTIFSLAPALPHESPLPFVPRGLAQRLWPGGFQPFAAPTVAPVPLIPAVPAPPVVPAPPAVDANGNQILRRQPLPAAPPAPRKRVLERGSFPAWH